MSSVGYAESIREKLMRVRAEEQQAKEEMQRTKETKPAEATGSTEGQQTAHAEDVNQKKVETCAEDGLEVDGSMYYHKCYCFKMDYSALQAAVKGNGITVASAVIRPMENAGDDEDNSDRFICGASLDWAKDNTLRFKTMPECYAFIENVVAYASQSAQIMKDALIDGCKQHML